MKRVSLTLMIAVLVSSGCSGLGSGSPDFVERQPSQVSTVPSPFYELTGVDAHGAPMWMDTTALQYNDVRIPTPFGTLRTMRNLVVARSPHKQIRWRRRFPDCTLGPIEPMADGGTAIGCGGTVTVLDAAGNDRWTANVDRYRIDGLATGTDGSVYAWGQRTDASGLPNSDNASLVASFDPRGELRWKGRINDLAGIDYDTGPDSDVEVSAASVGRDGTLYVGTTSHLTAISPQGAKTWQWHTHVFADIMLILIGRGGTVYAVGGDWGGPGLVLAFGEDGRHRWRADTDSILSDGLIGPDGSIYASDGDKLYRFAA